jgi:hypothetical protein
MTVVVLLYRANLPNGVETRPWHVRANGLPKPPEELLFLLLTEQQFATGQTLEPENEFGLLIFSLFRLENQMLVPSWTSV